MAAKNRVLIEICVDSVESALAAEAGGADRLELCQNLFEGGTTPSGGMIRCVRRAVKIPLFVIIRPRGADFCYSDAEFEVMREELQLAKELGADGIVLGILRPNGTVDRPRTRELIRLAHPLPVTFHRAFDVTRQPLEALETLVSLGVSRILTSGQEKSVLEGIEVIEELVHRAGKRVIIVPGGGISDRNFEKIRRLSGAKEFHLSGSTSVSSRMQYRNTRVPMGRELRPPEFGWSMADTAKISAITRAAKS